MDNELAVAVRERLADRARSTGLPAAHVADRDYPLRGLLSCAHCGRKMQGTMRGTRAYYRCPTSNAAHCGRRLSLYLREAAPVRLVDEWLAAELAAEAQAPTTAAELAKRCGPTPDEQDRINAARARIAEIDRKIARLADAFGAGLSPESFATLDRRYRAERATALAETAPTRAGGLSAEEFRMALADPAGLAGRLERASASQRRAIYDALGLDLRWDPAERSLHARVAPRGAKRRVGGGHALLRHSCSSSAPGRRLLELVFHTGLYCRS
ncbi:MAG: zinc ribbon domain-containing protein [Actinomycetota bacterium]|nr:zinc ribbon domain-containing protein [Actinomycetota bacterium]